MNRVISVKNLQHHFGDRTVLENITFDVSHGEIFGLLGPSGAGKTTLIHILTGQIKASGGSSFILGIPSRELTGGHYQKIGMMMDRFGLYERMSCYDNMKFYQMLDHKKERAIEDILADVGLLEAKKLPVMKLSKGMANRLAFARAILRSPAVLFLDEPTSGLDPTTVAAIHQMILREKKRGATIFLTTHNMFEAEKLCDNIALLNRGKIVEFGAPADICRRYYHQKKIYVHLKNGKDLVLEHKKECGEQLLPYFQREEIETIHSTEPNLETVFMELTGEKLKE